MASVAAAALPSLYSSSSSISRSCRHENSLPSSSSSSSSSFCFFPRTNNVATANYHHLTVKRKNFHGIITRVNAAIEEEEEAGTTTLVPEGDVETAEAVEQPFSVPVSASDILIIFLQAEGTMNESNVPKVISALEKIEGVSDVEVRIEGSVATVELTKHTTASSYTGVASNLVEVILGAGFKLQTLHLCFEDEEDQQIEEEDQQIEALTTY